MTKIKSLLTKIIDLLKEEKEYQFQLIGEFTINQDSSLIAKCAQSLTNLNQMIVNLQQVHSLVAEHQYDNVLNYLLTSSNHCDPTAFGNCFFEEEERDHIGMEMYATLMWKLLGAVPTPP